MSAVLSEECVEQPWTAHFLVNIFILSHITFSIYILMTNQQHNFKPELHIQLCCDPKKNNPPSSFMDGALFKIFAEGLIYWNL